MVDNPKALWKECLQVIKQNVKEAQYKAWFATIGFESYSQRDNSLLLTLPSQFAYEYLEENYLGLLSKVLCHFFGSNVRLSYRILTDKEHGISQTVKPDVPVDIDEPKKTVGVNASPTMLDAAQPQKIDPQLDTRRTFANFIEGDSNRLSRSVALSIAEHPDKSTFNPFFIYGPSGCGKTHLVNAVGVKTKEMYPNKRVLYVSARLFQVQYTNSVRNNTTNDFINFYQTIDMLIVDDVQEWITATKTQDTFFHIFNHLLRIGKRIILACDRPPVEMEGFNERLLTRFKSGLIAELEKPNVQLCKDILKNKIVRDGLAIPDNVVQYIAETANGSVRDLEGVINSLLAYSVVYNRDVDMCLAERVIKRAVKVDDRPLTVDDILEKVCHHFNVNQSQIFTSSRKRDLVVARQVSMYLAQKYTKMPASRIGKLVGGRDHSTVIHSCHQVETRLQVDKDFMEDIQSIENSFRLKL